MPRLWKLCSFYLKKKKKLGGEISLFGSGNGKNIGSYMEDV